MYRTISISVRLVVLSSVRYVIDQIYKQRVSMAAPLSQDPSRPGKGPSSRPNPPGAGAFLTTPSTTTDTGCASLLLTAGSAQSGSGLSSARADTYPASSRFLRHSGLGGITNRRLLLTAPKVPVRILTSGGQNQHQPMRADPPGLHAGSDNSYSAIRGSADSPHFNTRYTGWCGTVGGRDHHPPRYWARYGDHEWVCSIRAA